MSAKEEFNAEHQAYHGSKSIKRTDLLNFNVTPAHFAYWRENEKSQTEAMLFGTAYHLAVLEPYKYERFVGVLNEDAKAEPEKGWTSNKNKQAKQELAEQYPILLSEENANLIEQMRQRLYAKPHIAAFLSANDTQVEKEFHAESHGLNLAVKHDLWHPDWSLDLKTTKSAAPRYFNAVIRREYYFQTAMYLDVESGCTGDIEQLKPFGFIAQEKEPPYEAAIYWPTKELVQIGLNEYRALVEDLANCYKYNAFPGYEYWSTNPDNSFNVHFSNYDG